MLAPVALRIRAQRRSDREPLRNIRRCVSHDFSVPCGDDVAGGVGPAHAKVRRGLGFGLVSRWSMRVAAVNARARARWAALHAGMTIDRTVRFGPGVRCVAGAGAQVRIGRDVEIGGNSVLIAQPGATLDIADGVFIAGGCIVAAARHISIGADSMVAELVSIRDHDHDPAYPPRDGHTIVGELRVGARVWIGAKATIVRAAEDVGDDAVIGAHALVNRPVPAGWLSAGVPARPIRQVRADAIPRAPRSTGG